MRFLIITGMSGAGKSLAADILEDMDYYCVDNMPAALLPKFAEFCQDMGGRYDKVALVTDIRDRDGVDAIFNALGELMDYGCRYSILYVEADPGVIVKRYKETRRPHPLLSEAGSIEGAVRLEQERLMRLREAADYVINTSNLTIGRLSAEIFRLLSNGADRRHISVTVMSFGFKHGIPVEADMVLDVRFLPNPYYVPELRSLTGLDEPVRDYVMSGDIAARFLEKTQELLDFLIPQYVEEGKHTLTVAVGCTGGRHRSVAMAKALTDHINGLGQSAENVNRDIDR